MMDERSRGALTTRGMVIGGIVLVGLAFIVAIMAGYLVRSHNRFVARADEVTCVSNLREIQRLCMLYANHPAHRGCPYSKEGGIASLQVLVDAEPELFIRPSLFHCLADRDSEEAEVAGGKFKLDERHSSYEMSPVQASPGDPNHAIVAFDRKPWHDGKRAVVFLDGSADLVSEEKFQAMTAELPKR